MGLTPPSDTKGDQANADEMHRQQGCQMEIVDPFLSLDRARVEGRERNRRKGRDQILQRSVAEL